MELTFFICQLKLHTLFGLQLLDMLFTRAELSSSLLFKSTKSERGVLDPTKVSRIIGKLINTHKMYCVKQSFGFQIS